MTEQNNNEQKFEAVELVREIEKAMDEIPEKWHRYICQTGLPEDEVKAYFDLPPYWIYKEVSTTTKIKVALLYFERKKFFQLSVDFEKNYNEGKYLCCFANDLPFK
jgi:hypothetical protein